MSGGRAQHPGPLTPESKHIAKSRGSLPTARPRSGPSQHGHMSGGRSVMLLLHQQDFQVLNLKCRRAGEMPHTPEPPGSGRARAEGLRGVRRGPGREVRVQPPTGPPHPGAPSLPLPPPSAGPTGPSFPAIVTCRPPSGLLLLTFLPCLPVECSGVTSPCQSGPGPWTCT